MVGAYVALFQLERKATGIELAELTNDPKTGLMRHGEISYITFLEMYRSLHEEIELSGYLSHAHA